MENISDEKRAARVRLRALFSALENRDEIVREGKSAGYTKAEIVKLSGLARSTVDRILAPEAGQ